MNRPPDEHHTAGGEMDRITVGVRVSGDTLDPDAVTARMRAQPTFAARRGDHRLESGRVVVQRTGVWLVDFTGSPDEWTLEDAIDELLGRLPAELTTWKELAMTCRLEVTCGVQMRSFNRGVHLSSAVLQRLAERQLAIDLDIYFVGSAEDD